MGNASMVGQGVAGVVSAAASLVKPNFQTVGGMVLLATFLLLVTLPLYWFKFRWIPQVRSVERQKSEFMRISADARRSPSHSPPDAARRRRDIFFDAFPQARNVLLVFFIAFPVFPGVPLRWSSAYGIPASRFRP